MKLTKWINGTKKKAMIYSLAVWMGALGGLGTIQAAENKPVQKINERAQADENKETMQAEKDQAVALTDTELIQFVDDYMKNETEKEQIVGAVAAVVKDDQVLLQKGYGYSDDKEKTPVDPTVTTFPIASVSKLFTAASIMQLNEAGKLALETDVKDYIGNIPLNNPYEEKVTCGNLLTHSSGMDEGSELLEGTTDEKAILNQEAYFKNHHLNVVARPNTISRYSNLGYNLLGYIVEKRSGMSYEDYVQTHLLDPLQMKHSSVRIHDEHMTKGYIEEEGKLSEVPYAYQYTSGSAGIIATAEDMTHFMKAFLNEGQYEESQILAPKSVQAMRDKQFSNSEYLAGMAYGFVRVERNGHLILKHEGALPGYMSTLILIPEAKVGIYVSVNTFKPLPFTFEDALLDHFMPQQKVEVGKNQTKENFKDYVGTYRNYDGIAKSNLMKAAILLDETTDSKVSLTSSGQLKLEEYTQEKEPISTMLYEVGEGIFVRADGRGQYVFRKEKGKVTYAFNEVSHNAYERMPWYETKKVLGGILGLGMLAFLIDSIRCIRRINRRLHQRKTDLQKGMLYHEVCHLISDLLLLLTPVVAVGLMFAMVSAYDYQLIPALMLTLTGTIIGMILACGRLVTAIIDKVQEHSLSKGMWIEIVMVSISLLYGSVLFYLQLLGYKIG